VLTIVSYTLGGCTYAQNCSGCYDNKCINCRAGYNITADGSCKWGNISATTDYCVEYDMNNNCLQCSWPWVLTKIGTCTQNCSDATTTFQVTAGNRCVSVGTSASMLVSNTLTAGSTCVADELKCLRCRMSMPYNYQILAENGMVFLSYSTAASADGVVSTSIDGCGDVAKKYEVKYCLYYNSALMCDQCQRGFVLTPDSLACVEDSNGPSNCRKLMDLYGRMCKVCHDGYYASDIDSCKAI